MSISIRCTECDAHLQYTMTSSQLLQVTQFTVKPCKHCMAETIKEAEARLREDIASKDRGYAAFVKEVEKVKHAIADFFYILEEE